MWEWLKKWVGSGTIDLTGVTPVMTESTVQLNAWVPLVQARGNTVTRMPNGPNTGELAERYIDGQGAYRYALAPQNVRAEDAENAVVIQQQMNSGQLATATTDALQGIIDAPRNAAAGLLGIPPWAVTVVVLGVVYLAVRSLAEDV